MYYVNIQTCLKSREFLGVTKKAICLWGLAAARPKLISALSTIIYKRSRKAEIIFLAKIPAPIKYLMNKRAE